MSTRALLSASSGASKCRTIDVCDIFGDSSGVALYQLDGNANDTGGNYHGTETAMAWGGGEYGRGGVFNGASSKIDFTPIATAKAVSFWTNKPLTNGTFKSFFGRSSDATHLSTGEASGAYTSETLTLFTVTDLGAVYIRDVFNDTSWKHITVSYVANNNYLITVNGAYKTVYYYNTATNMIPLFAQMGTSNGGNWLDASIDQVRIFNRAVTATEVATLYAECAPTSTVDNINPFEDGSLKALYQFNGDATDKTGVYNGTATNVTYGTGKFGQCAVFNGTARVVYPFILQNISSTSFYFTSTAIANTQYLFSTNDGASTGGGYLIYLYTSQLRIAISGTSGWLVALNIGPTLLSNTRYFVETQYDGSIFKVFLDGALIYTSASIAMKASLVNARSGQDYSNANGLSGTIDQLRIFNKALTPMEVASLYNETTPMEEPMSHQVDPFKDGSGKALYRLEGNSLDESGNYNGIPASMTYAAGYAGRCGVFDGGGSSVQTPINQALMPIPFTYSLWVNTAVQSYGFFSNGVSGVTEATKFDNFGTSGRIRFASTGRIPEYQSLDPLPLNSWVHIVISWDGTLTTGAVKMYVNGILSSTTTATAVNTGYNSVFYIGRYGTYANYFNGKMDQVRYFNRALTLEEIQTLYTKGA